MGAWQNTRLSPRGSHFLYVDCPRCGHTVAVAPNMVRQLVGRTLICPECADHGNREEHAMPHALPIPS